MKPIMMIHLIKTSSIEATIPKNIAEIETASIGTFF